MSKDPNIYEDTCLHAGVLCDRAISDKFPELADDQIACHEITQWLEARLEREYRESEEFRKKLEPCSNTSADPGDANKIRDWLALELLPSWLPNSPEERKEPVTVWRFDYAPTAIQEAASQGGDEDWIAEIPPALDQYGLPFWIEAMDSMREPKRVTHPTKPGWQLIVGSH